MSVPFVVRWRSVVASEHGPESPTTRHVLLTLATHMNLDGGSCFPSVATLAVETGLTARTVITHLDIAARDRWVERHERAGTGRGWKRHSYTASLPDAVKEVHHVEAEGGERGSPRGARGGEPDDADAVKEVHPSSSVSSPETDPREHTRETRAVERFCAATDADWRLSTPLDQWAAQLPDEYPGVPVVNEVLKAAEWYEAKGKTLKAPDQALRNWLGRAEPSDNGGQPSMTMSAEELREWDAGL